MDIQSSSPKDLRVKTEDPRRSQFGERAPGGRVKPSGDAHTAAGLLHFMAHLEREDCFVYCLPHSLVAIGCHRQRQEPGA